MKYNSTQTLAIDNRMICSVRVITPEDVFEISSGGELLPCLLDFMVHSIALLDLQYKSVREAELLKIL